MSRWPRLSVLVCMALALPCCGGEDESDGDLPRTGLNKTAPGGNGKGRACAYPEGEPGVSVGLTVASELRWPGYAEGQSSPGAVAPADYLDCVGEGEVNALLILQVAEWCSVCALETEEISEEMAGGWAARGVHVLTLVTESLDGDPADVDTARRWKEAFGLDGAVAADPEFTFRVDYDFVPQKVLVNPRDMRVFHHALGAVDIAPQVELLLETTR